MALKPAPKVGLIVIALAAIFFFVRFAAGHGWLPSNIGKVVAPHKYDLPALEDAKLGNVQPAPYPSAVPAHVNAPQIRAEEWEWNAQLAWDYSNGGPDTTEGSLQAKRNVNLHIELQNDTNKMIQDLIACAKEIHDGADTCSTGANIIDIMGDQAAEVAAQANPQLKKLGPDYVLKIIGAVGYSRGEDACMLPASVKADPKSVAQTSMSTADGTELPVKGVLIAGSVHEGDWNICEKYAGDNAIPNNPDPKTFDAAAFNWVEEPDYITAAQDYVAGKCDDRKEVKNGKLTGRSVHVCINGVATWTPGDTIVAKRGGLVKAADSLMYRSQMPSVIIGSGHFINQHKEEFENMLRAAFEGADQVNAFDTAKHKATEVEAAIYKDKDSPASYWYKYFKPVKERDAQGQFVSIGGSAVTNLADNLILFGFNGSNNNMAATYNIFRSINLQQYPQQYRSDGPTPLPEARDVIDRTLIKDIDDAVTNGDTTDAGAVADTQDYSQSGTGETVSHRSYNINFATGSAQPLPDGVETLKGLKDSIAITGLKVKIDGYTDNTGSASINTTLSEERAQEVKSWLQQNAKSNFPSNRFESVEGHGPANPACPGNDTAACKAQNRRVEITLVQ